jgi:AraC-like DNA-binding protein
MTNTHFWQDSALPHVELRRADHCDACYAPHTHPTLAIGVVDAGRSVLAFDKQRVPLSSGDRVVIAPDEVHACNPLPDGRWSYRMLYVDRPWVEALLGEIKDCERGARIDCAWVSRRREHYRHFAVLAQLLYSGAGAEEKDAALVGYIGGLYTGHGARTGRSRPALSLALARAKELLRERAAEPLAIAELAQVAGMSRYHFMRAFKQVTGLPPHAFQLDLRINRARRLLREGRPLAWVAHAVGFADQAHFQRAFTHKSVI